MLKSRKVRKVLNRTLKMPEKNRNYITKLYIYKLSGFQLDNKEGRERSFESLNADLGLVSLMGAKN